MAYLPARTKYRKVHKGRIRGNAKRGDFLAFGEYGIQSLSRGKMTSNQIEASRVAVTRYLKRKGKLWIRVFPQKPITKKPAETRMGKERVELTTGLQLSALALFFLSFPVVLPQLPAKPLGVLMLSYHSAVVSSPEKTESFHTFLIPMKTKDLREKSLPEQNLLRHRRTC